MSNSTDDLGEEATPERREGGEEQPPTPFDHPLFLPILLLAGAVWFGYDGWLNSDPNMQEHVEFNRYGFGVLVLLTAWFGFKGVKEFLAERAERSQGASPPRPRAD